MKHPAGWVTEQVRQKLGGDKQVTIKPFERWLMICLAYSYSSITGHSTAEPTNINDVVLV